MFNLDDCIGVVTNRSAKVLAEAFSRRLEVHGITRTQWIGIYYIGEIEDMTQKNLAEKLSTTEPSVARLVDRLEKNDFVKRNKSIMDRRQTVLQLTEEGKRLREEMIPLGQTFSDELTKGITKEELDIFNKVIRKMINNVE